MISVFTVFSGGSQLLTTLECSCTAWEPVMDTNSEASPSAVHPNPEENHRGCVRHKHHCLWSWGLVTGSVSALCCSTVERPRAEGAKRHTSPWQLQASCSRCMPYMPLHNVLHIQLIMHHFFTHWCLITLQMTQWESALIQAENGPQVKTNKKDYF